jgi:hypothetical protein
MTLTLVEFIAPIRGSTNRDKLLAMLYFAHRYEDRDALTVDALRAMLSRARIPRAQRINVADVLVKAGDLVDTPGLDGRKRLWRLTSNGESYVRNLLGLPTAEPEVEHDVSSLNHLASTLGDEGVRGYVEEAVTCLQVGALRAAVVFLWAGAIRFLQDESMSHGGAAVTAAIRTHDPKARTISRVEDYAFVKEKSALLAFVDLGLLDKSERGTLEDALRLRNSCGHPTRYRPGLKKVSSFIEDVLGIVFA